MALHWYYLSLEAGRLEAVHRIAEIQRDRGNAVEAASLYGAAAEQGDAHSQYMLGYMHGRGEGVSKDYPMAAFW